MSDILFNDLLMKRDFDHAKVIVMRHRPFERELAKVLPWLAADKPDLFHAYQQTQGEKLERTMCTLEGVGYVASFIGREAGKALFVGIYEIAASRPLSREDYWKILAFAELKSLGM